MSLRADGRDSAQRFELWLYYQTNYLEAGNKVRRISQISGDVVRRYRNREITLRTAASFYGMSPALTSSGAM